MRRAADSAAAAAWLEPPISTLFTNQSCSQAIDTIIQGGSFDRLTTTCVLYPHYCAWPINCRIPALAVHEQVEWRRPCQLGIAPCMHCMQKGGLMMGKGNGSRESDRQAHRVQARLVASCRALPFDNLLLHHHPLAQSIAHLHSAAHTGRRRPIAANHVQVRFRRRRRRRHGPPGGPRRGHPDGLRRAQGGVLHLLRAPHHGQLHATE